MNLRRIQARALLAACGALTLASQLCAQIHPTAARTWDTNEPRDALIFTPAGGWIDQARVIEPSGSFVSILLATGPAQPPIDVDPNSPAIAVYVDWASLDALGASPRERVGVPLPEGGAPLELVLQHRERRTATQYTWFGQIAGVANSDVILVRHDDALRLVVRNSNYHGRTFEVRGFGANHVLYEFEASAADCAGAIRSAILPSEEEVGGGAAPTGGGQGPQHLLGGAPSDPTNVIDIMVVVSDQARSAYGSSSAFLADCHAMIADSNARVSLSGGSWTFRLVAAEWNILAGYSQHADMQHDLNELRLTVGQTLLGYTATDTITDQIQALRHFYRPDLVALITTNGTGIGWQPDNTGQLALATGYFVANRSLAVSGGTFAHEAGHNLGACHNTNASAPNCAQGINATDRGIERYCDVPDGICGGCEDTEYRTTMAYAVNTSVNNVRVQRYSVEGLTATLNGSFGTCVVNLWATDARAMLTFGVSRPFVSQYNVARSQIWAVVGGAGAQTGTWQEPVSKIRAASQLVLGGPDFGVIRARPGVYQETAGAPIVISNGCRIIPEGGVIRLQ